jgi:phosphoglycerate dehydrogenase-like enzyme
LVNQKIAGAALDVFETEPLPKDSRFFELENILLIPHIAGYSSDVTLKAGVMVAESVIAALNGEVPPHLLNKEVIK